MLFFRQEFKRYLNEVGSGKIGHGATIAIGEDKTSEIINCINQVLIEEGLSAKELKKVKNVGLIPSSKLIEIWNKENRSDFGCTTIQSFSNFSAQVARVIGFNRAITVAVTDYEKRCGISVIVEARKSAHRAYLEFSNIRPWDFSIFAELEPVICMNQYVGSFGMIHVTACDTIIDLWLGKEKENSRYVGRIYRGYKFGFTKVPYGSGEKLMAPYLAVLRHTKENTVKEFNKSQDEFSLRLDRRLETIVFV